jgi:hypothetical protein
MFLLKFRWLINHRSASVRRRSGPSSRRQACRVAPRLLPLEVRTLLSTLTVTNDGDSGSGSLRGALGSAFAGDTIKFAPSAYGTINLTSGPLKVTTSVSIDGPGADKITIDGNKTFQDLLVEANVTASVSGLTITGGEGPTGPSYAGGGILNNGTLTVTNCVVTKNSAPGYDAGGGINNVGSLTVTNSVVSDNTAAFGGGINNSGTLVLKGSTITGNSATFDGGGGINGYNGEINLADCVVSGNSGDGIGSRYAAITLTNCAVTDNSGLKPGEGYGQGIVCDSADVTLVNCVVSGNAGGVWISGTTLESPAATLTVTDSSIVNNKITSNGYYVAAGGGIVSVTADVIVTGSRIANNTATGYSAFAGGILMQTGLEDDAANVLTITDSTVEGNQAIGTGAYGSGSGGAIQTTSYASVSVTNSSFLDNTVSGGEGGAEGGAMDLQELVQGTITDSQFVNNQAVSTGLNPFSGGASGGAIANVTSSALTISGSTFTTNFVNGGANGGGGFGGAIYNAGDATLNLSSSLLVGNSAMGGAGATSGSSSIGGFGAGGALGNTGYAVANVTDSTFIGNAALGGADSVAGGQAGASYGGAIANAGATLAVTDSDITDNAVVGGAASNGATAANAEGGGIQNTPGSLLTVSGGTLIGNTAIGGAGGGDGQGGGVFNSGTAAFSGVLITLNSAIGGSGGGQGTGGGLYIAAGTVTLSKTTKVVGNFASTSSDNIYGPYTTS